jgi:peptidyl-prolyl cis-trans isomerase B (cyclophilin B)
MLRLVLLCLLACTLLLAACGGDDNDSGGSEAAATPTADSGPAPLDSAKTYVATVSTSMGDFEITLDSKQAPKTGGSFKSLADKGFFDKLTFHRVVPGFVIQGGDPNGDGSGGPGYSVEEAPPQDLKYTKDVVAMAKTQDEPAGTSGSQFFVVTANDAQLPPDYALLGKVTSGQDVVDKIGRVKTDDTEKPVKPVTIKTIKVTET